MRSTFFSHAHIRTAIGIFGAMFNRIYIARFDKTGTKIDKLCHVPILYVPRSRMFTKEWLKNEDSNRDIYERFYGVYPRICYEFNGMSYRSSVQLQKFAKSRSGHQFGYTPAPYTLTFTMNVIARDNLTALQVVEQILPYFKPSYVIECDSEVFDNINKDVKVNLTNITPNDDYDDLGNIRTVSYSLEFEMEVDLYGYVKGADLELTKIGECGIPVEAPIMELCPNPGEGEGMGEIIDTVVVDWHDIQVWSKFYPTLERDIIFQAEDGEIKVKGVTNPPDIPPLPPVGDFVKPT